MSDHKQSEMFSEEQLLDSSLKTERQINERLVRLREELRVGQWDYERLLPEQKRYEDCARRWRGITNFKYPQNKFDALEARAIIRFLKDWKSRSDNLDDEISQLEFLVKGIS